MLCFLHHYGPERAELLEAARLGTLEQLDAGAQPFDLILQLGEPVLDRLPARRGHLRHLVIVAGVSRIGFNSSSHHCASRLIADGRNIVQVSRWLGHHSPSFTLDLYAHLMDDGIGAPLPFGGLRRPRALRRA
jgi:integrase